MEERDIEPEEASLPPEAPEFGGVGIGTWLFRNCWCCRKEFDCRLTQDVQNGMVRGGRVPRRTLDRIGYPAEPKEDWRCLEFEPKKAPAPPAAR